MTRYIRPRHMIQNPEQFDVVRYEWERNNDGGTSFVIMQVPNTGLEHNDDTHKSVLGSQLGNKDVSLASRIPLVQLLTEQKES